MSHHTLRDTSISFIIGVLVGALIVFGYTYLTNTTTPSSSQQTRSFSSGSLTDEQLEKMSQRIGISKEELKKKVAAGEDVRSLMRANRSASGSTENSNFGR